MERGRIVAVGAHDELVTGIPLFARLAALQVAGEGWSGSQESR